MVVSTKTIVPASSFVSDVLAYGIATLLGFGWAEVVGTVLTVGMASAGPTDRRADAGRDRGPRPPCNFSRYDAEENDPIPEGGFI